MDRASRQQDRAEHLKTLVDRTTVLISIDMQCAFDAPPWPRRWNKGLDRNGLRLLATWRQRGFPIIHVRHDSVAPASTLRPGLPGHRFRDGFASLDGEILVTKSVNSGFIGTDLDAILRRLEARHLMVFGLSTDMCVSTTIRMGANLGWPITLVADACDCFDLPAVDGGTIPAESVHAAHIATLAYEFCDVISIEALSSMGFDDISDIAT
jgi:nicotinamidase-related amidase